MIDEKSLRLGNYVMYENTAHVVEELRGRNNTIVTRWIKGTDHYIHTADELDPIPLTEEILLKCGFEKDDNGLDMCDPEYEDWFEMGFPGIGRLSEAEGNSIVDDSGEIRINYLHQLQNLIYCLSGKELEVKL